LRYSHLGENAEEEREKSVIIKPFPKTIEVMTFFLKRMEEGDLKE